jgi:NADH-quinone oxidoreductase subunit G/NADP-reducing hydrogenase subunit HndD
MEQLEKGESPYHFIEVMGCPGGCIAGGGQPRSDDPDIKIKRMNALYKEDEGKTLRKSHDNPYIAAVYKEFLEYPGSYKSHELLHTHYIKRGEYNELLNGNSSENAKTKEKRKSEIPVQNNLPKRKTREELESVRILSLETENIRLKNELDDTLETINIYKRVITNITKQT